MVLGYKRSEEEEADREEENGYSFNNAVNSTARARRRITDVWFREFFATCVVIVIVHNTGHCIVISIVPYLPFESLTLPTCQSVSHSNSSYK